MSKFLIVVDFSYWLYHTIFGAQSVFEKKYKDEASQWIKPLEEVDENNVPNLLNCENFKKVLKNQVMKRCETIDWLAKQNCQDIIDTVDKVDIVFAIDDSVKKSFRKVLYPEYKAQRVLKKSQYQVPPIKDYILNVLFPELKLAEKYGYKMIKIEGAEGDDIIACLLNNFKDRYEGCLLIASDHDFLQIDGILQIDMMGRKHERKIGGEILNAKDFLLSKILLGDNADNINKVFNRVGEKKVLKLINDKETLKQMLKDNVDSLKQYDLNRKLISFEYIPKELNDKIVLKLNENLYSNDIINNDIDLSLFML